jgi:uncharacterized membrane protein YhaH (DUF805 family)
VSGTLVPQSLCNGCETLWTDASAANYSVMTVLDYSRPFIQMTSPSLDCGDLFSRLRQALLLFSGRMIDAYRQFWRNSFDFSGRSTPGQYWGAQAMNLLVFFLLILLFIVVAPAIGHVSGATPTYTFIVYGLAILIPSVSIQIRRLRDAGFDPWWILVGIIPWVGPLALFIVLCLPSRS